MEREKQEGAWQHVSAEIYVFLGQAEGIVGTACQKTEKVCCRAYTTPGRDGGIGMAVWHNYLLWIGGIGQGGKKTDGTQGKHITQSCNAAGQDSRFLQQA